MNNLYNNIQELTLEAPVSQVTLLEDRALVQRLGKVNLTPGLWRVIVEKVAPVLADKSLRAELVENDKNAIINDVRVRRKMLLKDADQPQEIQIFLAELRQLNQTFENLQEEFIHEGKTFQTFLQILIKAIQEIPVDAVWGQLDQLSWRSQFQTISQQLREIRHQEITNYYTQEQLRDKIQDLIRVIQSRLSPDLVYLAQIETDLMISEAGEYEIIFDYVVPNALWRPAHQARLLLEPEVKIAWQCDGYVWQRTGEDWHNVDLIFSTARTSLGVEPPLLKDDLLNVQEKPQYINIQWRNEKIQTTGVETPTVGNIELPGVDDGGEVRQMRTPTKATIPSDGMPYRVPLFSFETPAQIEYLLMPELSTSVVLKSQQRNTSAFPILAGPVDLIRNTEFVGKTSVLFMASGEEFNLGWGPDAAIRVKRIQESKTKKNNLTHWNVTTFTTQLFISNIGDETKVIKTIERLPVSEVEQVKVAVIKKQTTQEVQPDKNGFCTWNFTLEPYSQLHAQLVYQLQTAPEVQ